MIDKEFYFNTGMQRATELVVNKSMMGNSMEGYPRTYKLTAAFKDQPAVQEQYLAMAQYEVYKARLTAFVTYIEEIEKIPKGSFNIDAAYKKNVISCPINYN